ncbi:MAG: polysaccharide pyruvyl transferase family protein [Nostoc sp. LLA-1]|nr:polysaccharide pyruvyl transferase family protein [Cyanocohniella sp. LLY]
MKILITNTVALNGGDAAILLSIVDILCREFGDDTEFIIYDSKPDIASRYYPQLTWRKLIFLRITELNSIKSLEQILIKQIWYKISSFWYLKIKPFLFYLAAWCQVNRLKFISKIVLNKEELQDLYNYSSADLIVSTGGTYLVENYPLNPRIFDYQISLLMKRPLIFYTQSLGPFLNPKIRNQLRNIFNQSLLILLRDDLSFRYLEEIGVDKNKVHVSSDIVFSFKSQREPLRKEIFSSYPKNSPLKIAISVRYWNKFKTISIELGMNNFRSAMCAVTKYLVEQHNAEIIYLSTCQGIPEYWTDDSKFATEIYNLLPDSIQKKVTVNNNFHHPQNLVEMLTSYDLVIGTRMHMCILSLAAGIPVFPIAYEFKTKELFSRLGMSEWVQDIETINQMSLINSIEKFLNSLPQLKHDLMLEVEKEKERAVRSSFLVRESLEKWQQKYL